MSERQCKRRDPDGNRILLLLMPLFVDYMPKPWQPLKVLIAAEEALAHDHGWPSMKPAVSARFTDVYFSCGGEATFRGTKSINQPAAVYGHLGECVRPNRS